MIHPHKALQNCKGEVLHVFLHYENLKGSTYLALLTLTHLNKIQCKRLA